MNDLGAQAWQERLAARLAAQRLGRNWTQARLAEEAGVSLATLRRLEAGRSVQLSSWLRVLEALDLAPGLERLVPAPAEDPLLALELARRSERGRRRRASRRAPSPEARPGWTWGEDR